MPHPSRNSTGSIALPGSTKTSVYHWLISNQRSLFTEFHKDNSLRGPWLISCMDVQEANLDAAETEFRSRLFRHRFLHSTYVQHTAILSGPAPVAQLPPGPTATPGIASATLYYPLGAHPHHHASAGVAAVHQRDKPTHDSASQMWPGGPYAAGAPPTHTRGTHGLAQDGGQHVGLAVSSVPIGPPVAELQAASGDAVAASMRLSGTGRAPAQQQPAQQQQHIRYPITVAHPYLQMHGAAVAAGGVRIQAHEISAHERDHMGGRIVAVQEYQGQHAQHAQRAGSRPNSAMSAPSGVQHIMPPAQGMHAEVMHRRSMPGSPTERGQVNGDALQSYAAAAASESKREGGGGAVYDGLRGRNGAPMGPAQGGRNGGAHSAGRRRSATPLSSGPPPPPPPQSSGRQSFSHDTVHLHGDHQGAPHAQPLQGNPRDVGPAEVMDARGALPSAQTSHAGDTHLLQQSNQYCDIRGAPVSAATAAQHLSGPTAIFLPQHRGAGAPGDLPAGMQQITAIGLPTTAAQGAAYSGQLVPGTPIILAAGQSVHVPHGVPQHMQAQHRQQAHSMAAGAGAAIAGQPGGVGQAAPATVMPSAGLLQMDTAQPVPIQLGEHHRGLFPGTVDPQYAHLIRQVHPPFNSHGVCSLCRPGCASACQLCRCASLGTNSVVQLVT